MVGRALALGEYGFPERNRLAKATIEQYATQHAITDAGIGMAGFLPIPGAAPATIIASLAVQVPIYKSLARDLSRIYEAPLDDVTRAIVLDGILVGSVAKLSVDLASEFGREFITEIGSELVGEMGIAFAASFIPVLGGLFSMGLDVAVAATMTWRVGTMIAIYYEYGGKWLHSKQETYERAKDMTGGLSPSIDGRVDLNDITRRNKEVREYQAEELSEYMDRIIRKFNPGMSDNEIREHLREMKVRKEVIEEVLQRLRR